MEKKGAGKSYEKSRDEARTQRDQPPRHDFRVKLKELIVIPNIAAKLKVPPKTTRLKVPLTSLFHQAYGHPIRNCLALGYQLKELVKSGFLKDYMQESQENQALGGAGGDQGHEVPIHGEVHTISRGFSRGGCDGDHIGEAFINEGRGYSHTHLKFFLLVFSKFKEDIK